MAPQEIRNHVVAKPFMPFRMYVVDGTSYEIDHPMDIQVGLLHVSVGVDPDENGLYRRAVYISPNHVSRIEPMPQAQQVKGSGRP